MQDLQDAPWIRDAELNGMPSADPVFCPVCGEECETLYLAGGTDPVGCENCIEERDAYEWTEEHKEVPEWTES